MIIQTKFFGEITIDKKQVIDFPAGLPGFEQEKQFALIPLNEEGIYQVLQSIHNENIALIVTNPYLFQYSYEFNIDDSTLALLEIGSSEDVMVLSVLTLRDPFSETTINMQAPVVINHKMKKGKQLILNATPYHTKHLLASLGKEGEVDAGTESESK